MNKSAMIGALVGAGVVLAGGSVAGYAVMKKSEPQFAEVLAVAPVKEEVKTPVEQCHNVSKTHTRPVQDDHRIAGTVVGGVLGGVLGHQVGGGRGNDVATVVGAAAGGYAGNQVQKNMQKGDTYTTSEQRCKTVQKTSEKLIGYDVKYNLDGQIATVRMDHDPGLRIPAKDGQLMLAQSTETVPVNK